MWFSDGTGNGTRLFPKIIRPGRFGSNPAGFVVWEDKLYFSANDGVNGVELWVTDGTAAGTKIVKDMPRSSLFPQFMQGIGSRRLYLSGTTLKSGRELFVSDGTSAGTRLLAEMNFAGASGNPAFFAELNGSVLFAANDGVKGRELWCIDNGATASAIDLDLNRCIGGFLHATDPVLGQNMTVNSASRLNKPVNVIVLGFPTAIPASLFKSFIYFDLLHHSSSSQPTWDRPTTSHCPCRRTAASPAASRCYRPGAFRSVSQAQA